MADLPDLPEPSRRLHALQWKELIEKHGFAAGDHLKWHDSPEQRRKAAGPPPQFPRSIPSTVRHEGSDVTYWAHGKAVSYLEAVRIGNEEWATRQGDSAIIDSIGADETVALAREMFSGIAKDYLLVWANRTEAYSDTVAESLELVKQSVGREVRELWRKSEWHSAWFDRVCQAKVDNALAEQAGKEIRRARNFEMKHLENPHLSLAAIIAADGDLSSAKVFDSNEETLRLGREALGGVERSQRRSLERVVQQTVILQDANFNLRLAIADTVKAAAQGIDKAPVPEGGKPAVEAKTTPQGTIERSGGDGEEASTNGDQLSPAKQAETPKETASTARDANDVAARKQARALTVAKLIGELDQLKPQMIEDRKEYARLEIQHPEFLSFKIAEKRPELKTKILAIRGSRRHIRLAEELAAAHHGRQLATIQDDWKDYKPAVFKNKR